MRPVSIYHSERTMIFETYTCSLASGFIEYGFTFKASAETDDMLFDLVLGALKPCADLGDILEKAWEENEKYARAVCEAHDKQV
jgi:hypothetical protein